LTFNAFMRHIEEQIADSHKYEKLKEDERELTQQIQETTAKYKKLQNDFSREQEENNKEMSELKRQKNETQVEKDLHIQYLERRIQGEQSCQDRLHTKEENELQKEINRLDSVLSTEQEVNRAVEVHLKERVAMLNSRYREQDAKREAEVARIEAERNEIKDRKEKAAVENLEIMEWIN
jgi:hypothetical protein